MQPLKPSEQVLALEAVIKASRRPMLHGDPGIGKSEVMRHVADTLFAPKYGYIYDGRTLKDAVGKVTNERPWFRDVRAALLDAVDLRGVPTVLKGKTLWAVPEFLPTDPRGGIFFLDEINRGTEMVQNALFSLCDKGELGEFRLPPTWVPAAAVNDQDTGARAMGVALRSRFIHIDCRTDLNDVCNIAIQRNWEPMVIAYMRFMPQNLHKFDPKERVSPNPRGWEFVSQLIAQQPHPSIELSLIAGVVGDGVATDFVSFMRLYRSLPSIDTILMNPSKAPVPESNKPGVMFAISSALARVATEGNFGRILVYLARLPKEYEVMSVKDALVRTPELGSTPEFTKWAVANKSVTFA